MSHRALRIPVLVFGLVVAILLFASPDDAGAVQYRTTKATSYGPGLFGNRMYCGGRLGRDTIALAAAPGDPCGRVFLICHGGTCARLAVRDRCPSCSSAKRFDLSEGAVRRIWGVPSSRSWGSRTVWYRIVG